jgi:hypothetical protein
MRFTIFVFGFNRYENALACLPTCRMLTKQQLAIAMRYDLNAP